jgi:hypothetical protein
MPWRPTGLWEDTSKEGSTQASAPSFFFFFNLCGGTWGTAATIGLLYQHRVIVMVIVEKLVE